MGSRLDPNIARQKFYTEKFQKGCKFVAFYNHSNRDFTAGEISRLMEVATRNYSGLPWQTFLGSPVEAFVYVDISHASVSVGVALAADQMAFGHFDRQRSNDSVTDITVQLEEYAKGWLRRKDNRHSLESSTIVSGIEEVKRQFESS